MTYLGAVKKNYVNIILHYYTLSIGQVRLGTRLTQLNKGKVLIMTMDQ